MPTNKETALCIQKCRKYGLKATPQRILIYNELVASNGHLSPEQLYYRVKKIQSHISLATVYKALDAFYAVGLVAKVTCQDCTSAYYETNTDRHHHLICKNCHKIEDIYSNQLNILGIPESLVDEYKISGFSLQLEGICKECQAKLG